MNKTVKGSGACRKAYLNALWACYACLPVYVHDRDPMLCDFGNQNMYSGYDLLKDLGYTIAEILTDGCEDPQSWHEDTLHVVHILDGDSKMTFVL